MKNFIRLISLTIIGIFAFFIPFNSIPSKATTKITIDKVQIAKATVAVTKVEKIVKVTNFNTTSAQRQLNIAIKEVSKVKLLGKKYIGIYATLSNRNIVMGKKINIAIKKEEKELEKKVEAEEKARLIEEAENTVSEAEKFINNKNINMATNQTYLEHSQGHITKALEAVVKLDKASDTYKRLMSRIDVLNTIIINSMNDMPAMKPVIYLYPKIKQNLQVKIGNNVSLSCSYPKYNKDGWNITVYPDRTIVDKKTGRQYYCLYWEGVFKHNFNMSYGFVVEGKNTTAFLEDKLKKLGLTDKEANEFIIYWLPKLENNKYNLIHFATEEYNKQAPLKISPKPDTLIRILMVYKPLNKPITVKKQQIITPKRKGFVVVEWGGMETR